MAFSTIGQSAILLLSRQIRPLGVCKCLTKLNYTQRSRFYSSVASTKKLFTDKHEWILITNNVGTVGISHHAQDSLGDIVYAQLPSVGSSVMQEAECGALESVKAASELYSPVSGKVVEKNVAVEETPALINQSCYDKGWLFKVEISNLEELSKLMEEKQYEEFLKTDKNEP